MADSVLKFFEGASINLNKDPVDDIKAFMKHVSTGERVPKPLVQSTLCKLGQISGGLGKRLGEQQDANEFYLQALSPLAVDIDEKLDINQVFTCIDCGRKTEKVDPHVQSLTLTIPDKSGFEMSINALLKKYFEHDILEKWQ